jgi:hypothetical protein
VANISTQQVVFAYNKCIHFPLFLHLRDKKVDTSTTAFTTQINLFVGPKTRYFRFFHLALNFYEVLITFNKTSSKSVTADSIEKFF